MTYLLQVQTKDLGLMLKTECQAATIEGLFILAKEMVKNNSVVKGLKFRIFKYTKLNNKLVSSFIKEDTISN